MKEIVTIQVGSCPNFVVSHSWNSRAFISVGQGSSCLSAQLPQTLSNRTNSQFWNNNIKDVFPVSASGIEQSFRDKFTPPIKDEKAKMSSYVFCLLVFNKL
ncbi:hypothetical protein ACS0TY_000380 [Phlomoides rotata]